RAALPALAGLLNDEDLCDHAVAAIGQIGHGEQQVVASLVTVLKNEALLRQRQATAAQGSSNILDILTDRGLTWHVLGLRDLNERLADDSEERLDPRPDPNIVLCPNTCPALGQTGPATKSAIAALMEARRDPDPAVRLAAACAMVRIEPEKAKDV